MKRLFALLTVAAIALCAAPAAKAQTYGIKTLTNATTCAASAANAVAVVIDVRKQKDVALQIDNQNDASGATTFTLAYTRSVDGTSYNTALDVAAVTLNGVTKQTAITNLPSYGAGYIKISYVTNASATVNSTNLTLKAGLKIGSP